MLVKKFSFSVFCFLLLTFLHSETVYANEVSLNAYTNIVENSVYEIIHAESGKLLDIKDMSLNNGAELQIWEDTYAHDNQKFILSKDDLGWIIIPLHSMKVIEVRDSRTDDGAPVAQWENAHILTQRWFIADNNDGTVTFVNKHSLKVLDIQNNNTNNGTKVWLYTYNGTSAQKFYLRQQQVSDLASATWSRDFSKYPLETEKYPFIISNASNYHIDTFRKPIETQQYISKIDFLSESQVLELVKNAARKPDIINNLKTLLASESKDKSIEKIKKCLKEININIEASSIGTILAIAEILVTQEDNAQWNDFLDKVQVGHGIIKVTHTKYPVTRQQKLAGMFPNQDTFWITPISYYEYITWNQQSLNINNIDFNTGTWNYCFK